MEDLTKEEVIQLIDFYKNKTVELEFSYLMLQINNKRELKKQKELNDSAYKKLQNTLTEQNEQNVENFNKTIEYLKSEIKKCKNKKTKTQNVK
jgi:uncharacterized membrane-anchored protein YhcB (DUF1043 family)